MPPVLIRFECSWSIWGVRCQCSDTSHLLHPIDLVNIVVPVMLDCKHAPHRTKDSGNERLCAREGLRRQNNDVDSIIDAESYKLH